MTTIEEAIPSEYNEPMTRKDLVQKVKEIALTFKDLNNRDITTIIKNAYNTDIISDIEISNIIKNIKTSITNLDATPLHITEMLDVVSNTILDFNYTDWNAGKVLGFGSYGVVKIIEKDGEKIAFKEILSRYEGISSDLVREIGSYAILTAIGSQNTPRLVGFNFPNTDKSINVDDPDDGLDADTLGFAIELADTSLDAWINQFPKSDEPRYDEGVQERKELIPEIVDKLLESLAEIQACGIVNGDIKPDNMLLWFEKSGPRNGHIKKAAITDFGLATSFPGIGPHIYTPMYRAPEVWDSQRASFASDCWAFGMSIVWVCSQIHYYFDMDKGDNTFNDVEHLPTPDMTRRLSKYLRPDQVVLINNMISWNPEDRCVRHLLIKFPQRDWTLPTLEQGNTEITYKMRSILFSWMAEVCWKYDFHYHTLALAMDIVFRFYNSISTSKYNRNQLQKYGICALLIAALWGEESIPATSKFAALSGGVHPEKQIVDSTFEMLYEIHGLLWVPGLDRIIDTFKDLTKDSKVLRVGWKKIIKYLAPTKEGIILDFSTLI